jgi:hypothetical protein
MFVSVLVVWFGIIGLVCLVRLSVAKALAASVFGEFSTVLLMSFLFLGLLTLGERLGQSLSDRGFSLLWPRVEPWGFSLPGCCLGGGFDVFPLGGVFLLGFPIFGAGL